MGSRFATGTLLEFPVPFVYGSLPHVPENVTKKYTASCTLEPIYIYVCMHTSYIHTPRICVHACVFTLIRIYLYAYIYIYTCSYTYTYAVIHLHLHIYMYERGSFRVYLTPLWPSFLIIYIIELFLNSNNLNNSLIGIILGISII